MARHDASKYSARVDGSETNTSHGLILELVGEGKRVLDVGCASGYLAEALRSQGNQVSGVEVDPEAADKARPFLDQVVVGDVEELDLVEQFGPGRFDVLVFADVLEHLKDPLPVLRRARALLAEGGYAVLSIPNVAHASVRLSLLQGRFDYRPLGLLDDTHLRFFTSTTLEQMVEDAGFVTVDFRQTTAGPFDTEIPVERRDPGDPVLAAVEADPDSRAYQFVIRVMPADAGDSKVGEALTERNREVRALRRTLADIARLAGGGPNHPVVGVLDPGGDAPAALRALRHDTARLELRRRLAGFEVRGYTLDPGHAASGTGPDAVQSLAPWEPGTADALRASVDALVVLPGATDGSAGMMADLAEVGLPVHSVGAEPEILSLAGRLVDPGMRALRAEYLRVAGLIPADGPFTLHVPGAGSPERPAGPVVDLPADVSAMDLLGLIAAAERVVTGDPDMAALAAALGTPVTGAAPAGDPDAYRAGTEAVASRLTGSADRFFDDLSATVMLDGGSRLAGTVAQRLGELLSRVQVLEATNAGLTALLARERIAMASEVARLRSPAQPAAAPSAASHVLAEQLRADLNRSAAERAALENEINRLYATKTMRAVAPLRRLYGRVRSLRP